MSFIQLGNIRCHKIILTNKLFLRSLLLLLLLLRLENGLFGEKPNFIIIFTDDQGYNDLGCFGSANIKTPNIDRMSSMGMRLTNFHVASPVCSPSRAALLTGRYPARSGVRKVFFPRDKTGLNPREYTIAELLKEAGYKTKAVGKWHLGHKKAFLPTNHGFESYFGIPYSNDMNHDPSMEVAEECFFREGTSLEVFRKNNGQKNKVPLLRDHRVVEYPADQSTLTKRYVEESLEFIENNKGTPFFLYLAHSMPHVPLYASKEFEGKSDAGLYGDSIEEIDHGVGKIISKLKQLNIDKNTFVIYTSDNGPWVFKDDKKHRVKGDQHRRVGGSADPLRGAKFTTWEGGVRVPTVMLFPGRIPAGVINDQLASTIDLFPTMASFAGISIKSKRILDGMDLSILLRDPTKNGREVLYLQNKRSPAVIKGNWKLRDNQLFNLKKDLGEQEDLASQHPEVTKELNLLLQKHLEEVKIDASPLIEMEEP
jgi:arylsulfatase A